MKENQVTILLTTCDKYSDAWAPFFSLWKTYWPDCPYPFIMNTEEKSFSSEYFSVTAIPGGKGLKWSKRLKNCLKHIDTEYVLLCLEDYFIQAPVNTVIFNEALKTMNDTPDLGVIQFAIDIPAKYDATSIINEYFSPVPKYKEKKGNGRIYCVLSLYRTRYLKKLLLSTENPWQFECYGSIRSQFYREKVYRENDSHTRCFQYYIEPKYGYAISRGKWLPKNKELFAAHDIEVDFSNLGIMDEDEYSDYEARYSKKINVEKQRHTLKQKLILPFTDPSEFIDILRNMCKWYFPFLP